MQKIIQYTDIFGVNPKMYIDNKSAFKSSIGSVLTVCLFFIVLLASWVYGKDIYYKQNPNSIFTEESTLHPEIFQIKKNTFNFAFGLMQEDWEHYADETIYNLEYLLETRKNEVHTNGTAYSSLTHTNLKARKCLYSDFDLSPEYFNNLYFLEQLYCVDNYDLTNIEGDYGADQFTMIKGIIKPCQNNTESDVICNPQEQIDSILSNQYWALYFTDSFINPKNSTNPFDITGRSTYGYCTKDMYRSIDFYFRSIYIEDNSGIIFDSWSQKRGIQYSFEKEMSKNNPQEDATFLEFNIRFEKVKQTRVFRTYLNLAQVLANVGGVLKRIVKII